MARRRTSARKNRTAAYAGLRHAQGAPARNGFLLIALLSALVVVNLYVFVWDKDSSVRVLKQKAHGAQPMMKLPDKAIGEAAAPTGDGSSQLIKGRVEKADTLGKLLRRHGLTAAEGDEIIRALAGVLDYKAIRPGAAYQIHRGSEGSIVRFELEISRTQRVRVERQTSGGLVGSTD